MNPAVTQLFRLFPPGGPGLSCEADGVALGDVRLIRGSSNEGERRFEVRSAADLGEILRLAYGAQPADVVQRCHRALNRAAAQLEGGDLALASLEAVMSGFPDLAPPALAKLATFADLEKGGTAWQNEPRIPAGQSDGGQWTTGDSSPAAATNDNVRANPIPRTAGRSPDASTNPLLDDGVYRPGRDKPVLTPAGGPDEEDEGFRHGIGGNEPPYEFSELSELFPGLKNEAGLIVPMAPIDSFLGISALADETNLAATEAEYAKLTNEIRAIDPSWRDDDHLQSLDQMSWQGRADAIKSLVVDRAEVYYRVRGDIRPLQVETLKFLQEVTDIAYAQGAAMYQSANLRIYLSPQEAIGNFVDRRVRDQLTKFLVRYGVPFGPGQKITVNNRDYSAVNQSYRVPDARLGNISIDWSLVQKTLSSPQIRGFFLADSEPDAIVIVRPSQFGQGSSYMIRRPADYPTRR